VPVKIEVTKRQVPERDRKRDYDGRDLLRSISGMYDDVREHAYVNGDYGQDGQANHFFSYPPQGGRYSGRGDVTRERSICRGDQFLSNSPEAVYGVRRNLRLMSGMR